MSELISLKKLFTNSFFRIPDYQRGYSWRDLQLEELRSDVINLLPGKEHYTGMLSLKQLNEDYIQNWNDERWLIESRGYSAFHIVDGQQRLTTLIILINEIVNYYIKVNPDKQLNEIILNDTPLNEIIEEYLVLRKPGDVIKTYKFGYEKDNPSFEFFKTRILESEVTGHLEETFYTLNLENAKKYFARKIEELANTKGINAVGDLFKKITLKLVFNMYYIDDDFNVFIAFETMNNRGKRLSNLELLKNRLIYLSTLFDIDKTDQESLRRQINDTRKMIYGFLGKDKSKSLDDDEFLQNHWMIYFGYTRSNKVTYDSFLLNDYFTQQNIFNEPPLNYDENTNYEIDEDEDNMEGDNEESTEEPIKAGLSKNSKLQAKHIVSYIESMKILINSWYYIHHPEEIKETNISINLERLNRLGFVNFKPLATVIYSSDISNEDKAECFKLMERFVFLHYRLDGYFGTYKNSFFFNLAHQFYNGEKTIEEVKEELNKIEYLSDNNVANASGIITKFEKLSKYKGFYSWANIRYFLYEYERALDSTTEKIFPKDFFKKDEKDHVSIEHIYPQTPDDESWIVPFENYTNNQKKLLANSLGNLLPLSQSINSSLQNYPFDTKKSKRYSDGSHCEIEVSKFSQWTPNEILDRGLKMVKYMEERWGFVFENRYDRIKFLGLDFMAIEDDKNTDETKPIYEEKEEETKQIFSYDDHKYLTGHTRELFDGLKAEILKLSPKVKEEIRKLYIAFKYNTNFVDVEPQRRGLRLTLNMDYDDMDDPRGLCKDISHTGAWGNGNVSVIYEDINDLEYIMSLIEQSLNIQKQNSLF